MKYSGIGGQAVMEGIMMRNGSRYAVAVRKPDGEIVVKEETWNAFSDRHKWAKWPVIRGIVSFIESLYIGMKTLMYSASFEEVEESTKKDKKTGKEEKHAETMKQSDLVWSMILGVLLALAIFMAFPTLLTNLITKWTDNQFLIGLIEGLVRFAVFIIYLLAISGMKDIRRVYMYHGSEHKCINCVEHGLPLTVENVMKSSKEHRRCGTSFLVIVMLISIILFVFVRVDNIWLRLLSRLLFVPVVAGISFELLRFTGKKDNKLTWLLSRPGMWVQGLTTKEPTPDMAEVAIAAVEKVFDWRAYLEENFGDVQES